MVYLHFSTNLTEEELMLQAKYQKLKKKKKALMALKAPKPEPEKPILPKRPTEARDAREIARKLLKSGAIQAIKTPPPRPDHATFKRPRGGRERHVSHDRVGAASYQPFSANHDSPDEKTPPRVNNLYDSFISARENKKDDRQDSQKSKTGNTVFVSGLKITEEYLRKHFSLVGNIISISMEIEKHRGFVTFEKPESALRAINDLDGSTSGGITLQVSMARRQLQIERINEASSSSAWATSAASHPQKGHHRDGRPVTTYDDDMFS